MVPEKYPKNVANCVAYWHFAIFNRRHNDCNIVISSLSTGFIFKNAKQWPGMATTEKHTANGNTIDSNLRQISVLQVFEHTHRNQANRYEHNNKWRAHCKKNDCELECVAFRVSGEGAYKQMNDMAARCWCFWLCVLFEQHMLDVWCEWSVSDGRYGQ